ncbi:MAG: hypothetical protein ACRYE7_02350 [Janthinobacterium lividum]
MSGVLVATAIWSDCHRLAPSTPPLAHTHSSISVIIDWITNVHKGEIQ